MDGRRPQTATRHTVKASGRRPFEEDAESGLAVLAKRFVGLCRLLGLEAVRDEVAHPHVAATQVLDEQLAHHRVRPRHVWGGREPSVAIVGAEDGDTAGDQVAGEVLLSWESRIADQSDLAKLSHQRQGVGKDGRRARRVEDDVPAAVRRGGHDLRARLDDVPADWIRAAVLARHVQASGCRVDGEDMARAQQAHLLDNKLYDEAEGEYLDLIAERRVGPAGRGLSYVRHYVPACLFVRSPRRC